ncbi:MAG: YkgJ family cysteine cluster protein [Candidatus Bathyarchaeia archaeon]|nr:YkgJ family cysteine cluster protein [Candidatus Bathyarchaeota archaeon]
MHCLHCGKCCHRTEMELSLKDIQRLASAGFRPEDFITVHGDVPRLRNVNGWCYFYDPFKRRCKAYKLRPLGCRIYPVIYVEGEGFTLDKLCPMRHTVSEKEFKLKAKTLKKLLAKIDLERKAFLTLL